MNFRTHTLTTGRIISGGKDSSSNDILVHTARNNDILLHTQKPGSPFVNCGKDANNEEIRQAAIFCAKYSKDWKSHKQDLVINIFLKKDMKKDKTMKEGTWQVKKNDMIKIKKEEIEQLEKELLHETKK